MPYQVLYPCTKCDEETVVRIWPATRIDPADSTWDDGCEYCGAELQPDPIDDWETI